MARGLFDQQAVETGQTGNGLARMLVSGAALIAASSAAPAGAQTPPAQPQEASPPTGPQGRLVDQARYWSRQGRHDIAQQTLQRLLKAEPNNAEALYEMARVQIARGDTAAAQAYAEQLRRVIGNGGLSEQLRREMEIATLDHKALQQARNLVAQGDYTMALQVYDRALSGRQLVGDLAVEYFETMAGVEARWAEARAGLERQLAANPRDNRVAVALARIETYRAETRRAAIEKLLTLAEAETERQVALDAARDALQWLEATEEDRALFDVYAYFRPDDADVAAAFARIGQPSEQDTVAAARTRGYAMLNENRVEDAIDEFRELVSKDRNDVEALAGLGISLARKGEYAAAIENLRRAVRIDPEQREDFRRALASAEFGSEIQGVRRAIDAADYESANVLLSRLSPETNADRSQLAVVRGEIAMARGVHREAEAAYREAIDLDRTDENALAGLLDVLVEQGAADRLQAALSRYIGNPRTARGQASVAKARGWLATVRNDVEIAIDQYQDALLATPTDPWIRLAAARALRTGGREREAFELFEGVERTRDPQLAHAAALFAFEGGDWARVEALLSLVPNDARTSDMSRLGAHARIQIGVDRSLLSASVGDASEARRMLLALYEPGVTTADEAMLIGSALLELGDKRMAASLVRQGVQARTDVGVAQLTSAASLLTAADEYNAAEQVLVQLQGRIYELGDAERIELSAVYDNLMVARAREAIRAGDLARALDFVAPVNAENPVHSGALRALGEINIRAGRREEGLQFYISALDVEPSDLDALRGAVGVLADLRRYDDAHALIDDALMRGAGGADLFIMKSEVYRAAGRIRDALDAMEEAQRARRPAPSRFAALTQTANPFRNAPTQFADSAVAPAPAPAPAFNRPPLPDLTPRQAPRAGSSPRIASPPQVRDLPPPATSRLPAPRPIGETMATPEAGISPIAFTPSDEDWAERASEPVLFTRFEVIEPPAPTPVAITPPAQQRPLTERAPISPAPSAAPASAPARSAPLVLAQSPVVGPRPQAASVRERLESIGTPASGPQVVVPSNAPPSIREDGLEWEIAELESQVGLSTTEQFAFRWREGEEGLSQLTEFKVPLAFSTPLGTGRITATAEPVFLSAGNLGDDPLRRRRIGALASVVANQRLVAPDDAAGGVALGVAYDVAGFRVDIGSSPLGFEVPNIVGGVSYSNRLENGIAFEGSLARRAVTDSVLSYAGLIDPITGEKFGAVTDTRLRLGASIEAGDATLYLNAAAFVREGEASDTNNGQQADTGVSLKLGERFSSGFNLTYLGFENNRRHFTFGHGGYFSPQTFVSATIPLNYTYTSPRLSVEFRNAIGIQFFEEDAAPLFPNRSDLAVLAESVAFQEAALLPAQTKLPLAFDAESRTNLAARSGVTIDYRLTRSLSLRGGLSVDRSADWTEAVGVIGLRYVIGARR